MNNIYDKIIDKNKLNDFHLVFFNNEEIQVELLQQEYELYLKNNNKSILFLEFKEKLLRRLIEKVNLRRLITSLKIKFSYKKNKNIVLILLDFNQKKILMNKINSNNTFDFFYFYQHKVQKTIKSYTDFLKIKLNININLEKCYEYEDNDSKFENEHLKIYFCHIFEKHIFKEIHYDLFKYFKFYKIEDFNYLTKKEFSSIVNYLFLINNHIQNFMEKIIIQREKSSKENLKLSFKQLYKNLDKVEKSKELENSVKTRKIIYLNHKNIKNDLYIIKNSSLIKNHLKKLESSLDKILMIKNISLC